MGGRYQICKNLVQIFTTRLPLAGSACPRSHLRSLLRLHCWTAHPLAWLSAAHEPFWLLRHYLLLFFRIKFKLPRHLTDQSFYQHTKHIEWTCGPRHRNERLLVPLNWSTSRIRMPTPAINGLDKTLNTCRISLIACRISGCRER